MVTKKYITGILLFTLSLFFNTVFAQTKPLVDESAMKNWTSTSEKVAAISPKGKYVFYSTTFEHDARTIGILQSAKGDIIKSWALAPGKNRNSGYFANDSYFIYMVKDSLFGIETSSGSRKLLALATSFRVLPPGYAYQLAYLRKMNNSKQELALASIDGKIQIVGEASLILGLKDGNLRFVKKIDGNSIEYSYNLKTKQSQIKGLRESSMLKTDANGINSIWQVDRKGNLYKIGDDSRLQSQQGLKIAEVRGISASGTIRLGLSKVISKEMVKNGAGTEVKLTLWSYLDKRLQSEQKRSPQEPIVTFAALMFPSDGTILQIESDRYRARDLESGAWLIWDDQDRANDRANAVVYAFGQRKYAYLINEKDGQKIGLTGLDSTSLKGVSALTKNGKYLIYYNYTSGDFFSFDLLKKLTVNLSNKIVGINRKNGADIGSRPYPRQVVYIPDGSFPGEISDGSLIASDEFDLWKINPSGATSPICLTSSYGRKNKIEFRPVVAGDRLGNWQNRAIVIGFSQQTKQDGFFGVSFEKPGVPTKIVFEDFLFTQGGKIETAIKAADVDAILFLKSTALESPNWYILDGKGERKLSDIHPEKKYNWMSSELVNWKDRSGAPMQGILFKPENFDPNRKYPVIINFYETKSFLLHDFHRPEYVVADINIPWMVSRGYLVFQPDMKYRVGSAGKSALECLETGRDEICKRKYVDSARIGISGHSYGGFEAAYFVTHSNRYQAALVSAPLTNHTSRNNNSSRTTFLREIEWAQGGFTTTLWDRPEWYIENSAVFNLDKVKTPILMMHNKDDGAVSYSQGMEMFIGLYRLGKPVWMLEYEGEGHILSNEAHRKDLTIRTQQFFDHYLKGTPAPLWMLEGIAYKDRGYKTGLELDTLGRKPGKSPLISEAEQKLIDEYSKIPLSEKLKRYRD